MDRVIDFAAFAVVDNGFARIGRSFATDLTEERGKGIVIVLGPLVKRMVVTLGALNPHAHENLSYVLGDFQAITFDLVIISRWIDESSAGRGKQLTDDLIHRNVVGNPLLQPIEIKQGRFVAHALVLIRLDLEKLCEFHDPHLGEFFTFEEAVDQFGSLVRGGVGHEFIVGFLVGQGTGDVESDATDKHLVRAKTRGGDAQFVQFVVHERIDVIVDRCFGSLVFEVFGNDDHLNAYGENVEPGHHEGLSSFVSRNQSFLVDRGRNVVAGLKHGQGGDVTGGAVRVVSKHGQLLRGTGAFQKCGRWKQLDSIGLCNVLGVLRSTVSQPANQGLPMFTVLLKQFSTGMRDGFDGFFDKQTFLRNSQVNAPGSFLTGDPEVVAFRVVSEQRKHETILPPSRSMAGSRIATCLHEYRHYVEVEADRPFGRSPLNFDRDDFGLTFKGDLEFRFSVLERMKNHIFPLDNPRLAEGKGGFPRDVPRDVVIVFGLYHDGVEIFFGLQANGWRISFEPYKFFAAGLFSQSQGTFRLGMQLVAARPICSSLDPSGQDVLLRVRKRPVLGRHDLIVGGGKINPFEKEALGQIFGDERGSGIAPFLRKLRSVQAKISLLFVDAVTLNA